MKERQLLKRELAESASSAMPSDTSSDILGNGSFAAPSRIQATLFQRGIAGIVLRRAIEPPESRKEDKEKF